jgi:cellobiose-specific phosphotransferase system component IIA|tara:strand:+ start:637 stop:825 length:189 start_codon:yes stop_codon:yes gene_type:complete
MVYSNWSKFERSLMHFGTRVEMITAMQMANKMSEEEAYQQIKAMYKDLKKAHKKFDKEQSID